MQTKAPCDDGTSKRGDLYFESGKDACMSANVKTLYIFFIYFVAGKILNVVQQDWVPKKKEKKKKENH